MNTTIKCEAYENCGVIRDLAELYKERLVSPETEKAVGTHLKTCSACRKYYQDYDAAMREAPQKPAPMHESMAGTELRLWQNLSEKMRRRRTVQIIGTGAVIGAGSIMLAVGLIMMSKSMGGLK